MKDKILPPDINTSSLEELTEKANQIIETLENEKNLINSVESYQELLKLNKIIKIKRDRINTIIVKKYLFISSKSKFILVNINLFIKTFFGLLNDKI